MDKKVIADAALCRKLSTYAEVEADKAFQGIISVKVLDNIEDDDL